MMKRAFLAVLAATMLLTMAGCGEKAENDTISVTSADIHSISDERIIGQWISTDSTMSHGHTLDFYDGGIGEELVKIGGERTEFGFEWYAVGDKVLVDTGTEKEIYTYGKDEYGEIHMINETKDLELFKQ